MRALFYKEYPMEAFAIATFKVLMPFIVIGLIFQAFL